MFVLPRDEDARLPRLPTPGAEPFAAQPAASDHGHTAQPAAAEPSSTTKLTAEPAPTQPAATEPADEGSSCLSGRAARCGGRGGGGRREGMPRQRRRGEGRREGDGRGGKRMDGGRRGPGEGKGGRRCCTPNRALGLRE
ncbi:hypothetical protein T492DRAFT_473972 [Pavlovales sp. CCMP2436]|nr:hypothetical protein T492DRAFT_473972 [Pavlovales sp. CCMP2436]